MNKSPYIVPDWPLPPHIQAYSTLRQCGFSESPYDSFNLAAHVDDNPEHVQKNRDHLKALLHLPTEPIWIQQTHSTIASVAVPENRGKEADATFTNQPNQVCIVLTADCLPILLCDHKGTKVSAIHAGWRGLFNGIIAETLKKMDCKKTEILAWLGPAIGPTAYEVGNEIRDIFMQSDTLSHSAFTPSKNGRWMCNLYAIARIQLQKQGIHSIYGGTHCTYSDAHNFFSYRRDGIKTGRMATLIWINDPITG